MLDVLFLAFALSVDAFTVAFSYGLIFKKDSLQNSLRLSAATGIGQFAFPLIGWLATGSVHRYIEAFDHWLAFFAFFILGVNVIVEAFREDDDEETHLAKNLTLRTLFMIGVATSIDACVSGISLYFMPVNILLSALVIGIICFCCTICGFYASFCFKKLPKKYMELFAGLVLILLGCKVLYEHLS